MHLQRLFKFLESFCFHKTCQHLFSINTIHINFGGNWLVYVYHISLNKASDGENKVRQSCVSAAVGPPALSRSRWDWKQGG